EVLEWKWTPDGRRVVYLANQNTRGITELFSVKADGSGRTRLNDSLRSDADVVAGSWTISPLSTHVAYLADQDTDEAFDLYNAAIDGSSRVKLNAGLSDGGSIASWQWAPDGSRISYVMDQHGSGEFDLFSVLPNATGRIVLNLPLANGGSFQAVKWAADGSRVFYSAEQESRGVFELYSAAADGSSLDKLNSSLVAGGSIDSAEAWMPSPDGA